MARQREAAAALLDEGESLACRLFACVVDDGVGIEPSDPAKLLFGAIDLLAAPKEERGVLLVERFEAWER